MPTHSIPRGFRLSVQTVFLGFDRPALQAATSYLAARFGRGQAISMRGVTIVTPTARAARRLQTLLADFADRQHLAFVAPHVVSVSQVPELLYTARLPFASLFTQQLAWARALRQDASIRQVLVPAADRAVPAWSERQWLDAGATIWRMYRELAAEGFSFKDVADIANHWPDWPDADRWRQLSALQAAYWRLIRELGLWDQQSARLLAVQKRECHTKQQLILIGTTDINRTLRAMLQQVKDQVTVLIHAPEAWRDRFDEFGVVRPAAWEHVAIDLQDTDWTVADNPESQAESAVDWLAGVASQYTMEQVAVGCADARLVPYLQRQLATRGIESRWGGGRAVSETAPCLLLRSIRNWLASGRREDFAQLARHPDMVDWLLGQRVSPIWLSELDKYHELHLSSEYGTWLEDRRLTLKHLPAAFRQIDRLLKPLRQKPQPLAAWMEPLRGVLQDVYRQALLDRTDPIDKDVIHSCQQIVSQFDGLACVPRTVTGTMAAGEAIDILLSGLESTRVTTGETAQQMEILGWLELPLDDSLVLVVCGVHEGTVPQAVTSDQFLPNPLRQRLGIDDTAARYARDAYALSTLLSGQRHVHFVVGRTTAEGDPLRPSRLLLAAEGDDLVKRWARFLTPRLTTWSDNSGPQPESSTASRSGMSAFDIARPNELVEVPQVLSVSAFKTYLQCPFRFYLKHVLRLQEASDARRDMSAWLFGEVVHEVLDDFGRQGPIDSIDPHEISEYCVGSLKRTAAARFGEHALPAVQIQLVQIERMLSAFAVAQASRAQQGWRIRLVEQQATCSLSVDGEPMQITGRIDRIDQHEESGEWTILDYKTSREAKDPGPTHRGKDGTWHDLQLPLYRHLSATLGIRDTELGYFAVPTNNPCRVTVLAWEEEQFQAADQKIHDVIRAIRRREFWPPKEPTYDDEWRDICMVGTLERPTF